jgi:hypothetical protein
MKRGWLVAILVCACSKQEDPKPAPDCAPLAEQAKTDWKAAAGEMAKLGAPCTAHVEPVVAAMVSAMVAKTYGPPELAAAKALLEHVPLSADQNQRILDATTRLAAVAAPEHVAEVKDQAKRCIHNRDKPLAPPRK